MATQIFLFALSCFLSISSILSKSEYCGSSIPQDSSSCTLYTTNDTYCCYLTTYHNNFYSDMCYPIKKTEYLSRNNEIDFEGIPFKIDCGVNVGTTCGTITHPVDYKDCALSSLPDNKCCFIEYKGDTSCVWLGSSNRGKLEYKGLTIKCSGNFLSQYWGLFLILVYFLI